MGGEGEGKAEAASQKVCGQHFATECSKITAVRGTCLVVWHSSHRWQVCIVGEDSAYCSSVNSSPALSSQTPHTEHPEPIDLTGEGLAKEHLLCGDERPPELRGGSAGPNTVDKAIEEGRRKAAEREQRRSMAKGDGDTTMERKENHREVIVAKIVEVAVEVEVIREVEVPVEVEVIREVEVIKEVMVEVDDGAEQLQLKVGELEDQKRENIRCREALAEAEARLTALNNSPDDALKYSQLQVLYKGLQQQMEQRRQQDQECSEPVEPTKSPGCALAEVPEGTESSSFMAGLVAGVTILSVGLFCKRQFLR